MAFTFDVAREAQYDKYIAAKKRRSDILTFVTSVGLLMTLTRCLWTRGCSPFVHPWHAIFGVIASIFRAWALFYSPHRYVRLRNLLLAVTWFNSATSILMSHRLLEDALAPGASALTSLLCLCTFKWPLLLYLMHAYRPKLSWLPFVQFPGLLLMNAGAFHAATVFEAPISRNMWVGHLTRHMNAALRTLVTWLVHAIFLAAPDEGDDADVAPLLSSRQCVLVLWLLLQGAAFWWGFWMTAREEVANRLDFLHMVEQGREPPPLWRPEELLVQLCGIQVYVGLLLVLASDDRHGLWPLSIAPRL